MFVVEKLDYFNLFEILLIFLLWLEHIIVGAKTPCPQLVRYSYAPK
jgi:hypothetical protein